MKYNVHAYVVIRVKIPDIDAEGVLDAASKCMNYVNLNEMKNISFQHKGKRIDVIFEDPDFLDFTVDKMNGDEVVDSQLVTIEELID